jgi:DNA-binding response OmpR family regulator
MTNRDRFTLLVAAHDDAVRGFLTDNLVADGYDVRPAEDPHEALRVLEHDFPDLALLDAGLGAAAAGLDLLSEVRAADGIASRMDPHLPVVLLLAGHGELERLRAFERGADDALPRPFSYPELRLRIDAVLRRAAGRRGSGRLRVGDLQIDVSARTARVGEVALDLSAKEFALLRVLAGDPTRVFTKLELLRAVWGSSAVGSTRTLDSHACRLRRKLGTGGGRWIVNVWGVGYRLVDVPVVAEPALAAAA